MRAGMLKEALEIYRVFSIAVLFKADRDYQSLVLFCLDIARVECVVNTAKVDEVECRAPHNEKGLEIVHSVDAADVAENAAALCHLELTGTDELIVYKRAVREAIGVVFDRAELAAFFLLGFCLYGSNLYHFFCRDISICPFRAHRARVRRSRCA